MPGLRYSKAPATLTRKQNTFTTITTNPEINVGTKNFADLLLTSDVFVDKSMFIEEFLAASSGKMVLITRPRRWGKNLNMDMLKWFLTIEVNEQRDSLPQEESLNRKLFVGGEVVIGPKTGKAKQLAPRKIAHQHPELVSDYQGQYPVISLGLKDVKGSSYKRIEASVKAQIIELYTEDTGKGSRAILQQVYARLTKQFIGLLPDRERERAAGAGQMLY